MTTKMNRIRVTYTITATEYIEWPEDEMEHLNYDNLYCSLDADKSSTLRDVDEITGVEVNDEPINF